jgi:hypothetical protein
MLLILAGVIVFFEFMKRTSRNRILDFSDGWTVNFKGVQYEDVDLDGFRFPGGLNR